MDKRKLFISIMAGFLALVMILSIIFSIIPTFASAAASSSELKQQLNELKADKKKIDSQIKNLEGQLSDNLDEMEKMVAQKKVIDQEIFMLHEQVNNINAQVSTLALLIAEKQEELDEAEKHLEELNKKNKERIRAMEEDGKLSYWSVLFAANDFSDLLDRLNMIEEIAISDQQRLQQMSDAAEAVSKAKSELEAEADSLEATKKDLAESEKKLEKKSEEADKLLSKLVATGEKYEALIDKAEKESNKLKEDISDKKDEYDDAKYQEWLATYVPPTKPSKPSGGGNAGEEHVVGNVKWLVPCNYTRFSSPYGWRIHPVYKDWRFHSGVDLSAKQGTPIIASRSGIVKWATYEWASGYYVEIDHRDGFSTKYLHMTHYVVKKGDYVAAGQVVGYVGSTGTSTGPHLHFGIYKNGNSVNPANYINFR